MKLKNFSTALLVALLCSTASVHADGFATKDRVRENARSDLLFLEHLIETKYAPLPWKKFLFDWNLEREVNRCKVKIALQENLTTRYCQSVFAEFLESLNDYHAGVTFYSSEKAYLPFELKISDTGRCFVVSVSKAITNLQVGDEIIEIEGIPILQVIESLRKGRGSLADYAAAVREITFRSAALGQQVPKGLVTIKVRRVSGITRVLMERWRYSPENVVDFSFVYPLAPKEVSIKSSVFPEGRGENKRATVFGTKMVPYFLEELKAQNKIADRSSSFSLGDKNGFLPNLGIPVWQADGEGPFRAYIFGLTDNQGQDRKVGYIRIGTYLWTDLVPEDGKDEPWKNFEAIVSKMDAETDLLIIDQMNNPGGSVFYLYGLVSMLTDRPLNTPMHRLILTQEDVSAASGWLELLEDVYTDEQARVALGEDMEGFCIDVRGAEAMRSYSRSVLSEWQSGRYDLTSPIALLGFDKIHPHPRVNYGKPIIALINEDNYSCADLFAALLKDNERALLVGKTTAGAGGFVCEVTFPNRSGIRRCSLTGSLAVRGDGSFIENVGVAPQIDLGFTEKDLQTGRFTDYINSVLSLAKDLLTQKGEGRSNLGGSPSEEPMEDGRLGA
ncbi:protease-like activity factor CPAF [Chlamydiifrater volucris]|uniref:protease-like activity factor CPAF n=1 Tax=Chlamydiifrater volucris TaxID=2681470 RepID=UPI001BCCF4D9|nr:protease-like activity factor CPAF [Chlamydiifrater volucris]